MKMIFKNVLRRFVALFACICIFASGTGVLWAQASTVTLGFGESAGFGDTNDALAIQNLLAQADTGSLGFDITAPTIAHTPSISKGVAGEVQTIVAEISDNQSVESALLIYRNSTADFYSTTTMSADVTNTTWLATVDTSGEDTLVHYYIVAEDTDGNRVQKGSESNPLTLELQQSEFFSAITPVKKGNRNTWLAIGLGVFVVGALLASGGGDGEGNDGLTSSDGNNNCCTITFIVPNVNTD